MSNNQSVLPRTIEALAQTAYPSFALLAGMELDLFTPLANRPLDASAVARGAGTDPGKTAQLLHALVAIGLMRFDGNRFSNSPEADKYLVRGKTDYIGMRHHAYRRRWESMLRVGDTVRTGNPSAAWITQPCRTSFESPSIAE